MIAGCSSRPAPAPAAAAPPPGFFGAVAADEPQAALIGREILAAGGTAADAAIATYFAMAVTLPSQASLAGGGMCVSFNTATNEAQALEFLARPSSPAQSGGDRPTAIPGNIRGFFALHGVYGRLRWSQLLAPAENLARFGVPVSRALSTDLTQVESALAREPRMRRIFSAEGGRRMVADGDTLVQPDLAAVLASVRTSGPGDFYSGPLSVRFLQGVREAGGSLSREDLAYQPVWRKPLMVGFDDERAYFAPPPPAGGVIAGQTWAMLVKDDRFNRASPADRDALLVSAAGRAFADRRQWATGGADLQSLVSAARVDTLLGGRNDGAATRAVAAGQPATENPAAATLVAIDGQGSAVACAVTLNSLFGTGRVAGDTGIVLASSPGQGGRGGAMLGPMVVIKPSGREFVFAGAAAGGVAAPTALVDVASRVLLAGEPLDAASEAPRMHGGSDPEIVYVEPGASTRSVRTLTDLGYEAVSAERLGRVNAIACPGGLQSRPETCAAATDPRGFGLAVSTE